MEVGEKAVRQFSRSSKLFAFFQSRSSQPCRIRQPRVSQLMCRPGKLDQLDETVLSSSQVQQQRA